MLCSICSVCYFLFFISIAVCDYDVKISTNAPAVLGSTITFHADLYNNGQQKDGSYIFNWRDTTSPQHYYKNATKKPYSNWSVTYSAADGILPGTYVVEVIVDWDWDWIDYKLTSKRLEFEVTDLLRGELSLTQNGTVRSNEYVSSAQDLNQTISVAQPDLDFLAKNATYVTTYWFVDCVYMGASNNYTLVSKYMVENQKYDIEALVVAAFEPLPDPTTTTTTTPAPTTTTTAPTTTTPAPTTTTTPAPTTTPTTTTPAPTSTSTSSTTTIPSPKKSSDVTTITKAPTSKREISAYDELIKNQTVFEPIVVQKPDNPTSDITETSTKVSYSPKFPESSQPFVCFNKSSVAPDPKKVYGYFHREIVVKNPVSNVTVTGNLWLQHSDILNLDVKYTGTPPFDYCVKREADTYNVTGNETCDDWTPTDSTSFSITHYLSETYTLIIIVRNHVMQINKEVKVNIYEATKQSQLSVIVVPVAFSLVAVILVVFGVAYYMQNRNRFAVEVADFNFGETASVDMEYKTFRQRLFDSIRDFVMPHREENGSDSSLEYGPMT